MDSQLLRDLALAKLADCVAGGWLWYTLFYHSKRIQNTVWGALLVYRLIVSVSIVVDFVGTLSTLTVLR